MIEQLKEMFEMQKDFDNQVLSKLGKGYDYEIAEKMEISLFVELGELMQELPSYFKFWKQNKQDNREKALEEYVDALKFCLSLANYNGLDITCFYEYEACNELISISLAMNSVVRCVGFYKSLESLFSLGNAFGFTWDEIYETFKNKHEINIQRLKDGY